MSALALSFLKVIPDNFTLSVYVRPSDPAVQLSTGQKHRRLPDDSGEYVDFIVSDFEAEGFAARVIPARENFELTKEGMFSALVARCKAELAPGQWRTEADTFSRRVFLKIAEHPEGVQEVWLEPYHLAARGLFGFLIDFTFTVKAGQFSVRRIQQLSLSLDSRLQSNANSYADRFSMIERALRTYHGQLFPLTVGGTSLGVSQQLMELPELRLVKKEYVFAGNAGSNSQFMGVKEHGPLQEAPGDTQLYFAYRQEDKTLSHDLYKALRGTTFRTFPGFEAMFRLAIGSGNVFGVPINDFTPEQITEAVDKVKSQASGSHAVAVVITPFSKWDPDEEKAPYWTIKHAFLANGIATQVVTTDKLRDPNSLKWAVSNIGLGIFAKLGGRPWKLNPRTQKCLIVGVGRAHLFTEKGIERYYAYSVLTDASGVYQEMRVLGEAVNENDYLSQLRVTLGAIIKEYSGAFQTFVIHAPYTIRGNELTAIHETLNQAQGEGRQLVVMKFNERSRFFGYALENNSLIPYESSYLALGKSEYLIWFEGLHYGGAGANKRFGRPVHVRFDYPRDPLPAERQRDFLQDAVNLSGANWRGFNAKSLPVSVFYSQLIARHIGHFQDLGLPDVNFASLPPWFL